MALGRSPMNARVRELAGDCVHEKAYCQFFCIKLLLCPQGMRKDRSRVLRRDKPRTGTSDRDKASKDLEHKTVSLQDARKCLSTGGRGGGGRKSSITCMPSDQVLI